MLLQYHTMLCHKFVSYIAINGCILRALFNAQCCSMFIVFTSWHPQLQRCIFSCCILAGNTKLSSSCSSFLFLPGFHLALSFTLSGRRFAANPCIFSYCILTNIAVFPPFFLLPFRYSLWRSLARPLFSPTVHSLSRLSVLQHFFTHGVCSE